MATWLVGARLVNYRLNHLRFFREIVTVEERVGNDAYAEPVYGPPVRYLAKVMRSSRQVRATASEQRTPGNVGGVGLTVRFAPVRVEPSGARTVLAGSPPMTPEARITLADGAQPVIQAVNEFTDLSGSRYLTVRC